MSTLYREETRTAAADVSLDMGKYFKREETMMMGDSNTLSVSRRPDRIYSHKCKVVQHHHFENKSGVRFRKGLLRAVPVPGEHYSLVPTQYLSYILWSV